MRFRKLRIARSIGWGVLAVLLVVMWARSFWYCEGVLSVFGNVTTVRGTIVVNLFDFVYGWKCENKQWAVTQASPERWSDDAPMPRWPPIRFDQSHIGVFCIELEYWFLSLLFALLGFTVWKSTLVLRFSLRTLLIATTLVAVVLGLAVYVSTK